MTTSTQIANLPATSCTSFTPENFKTISDNATTGFTTAQVAQFMEWGACPGITASQMTALSGSAYSGFTWSCMRKVSPAALAGATADGLSHLQNQTCEAFVAQQTAAIAPEAYSGFSPSCMHKLSWLGDSSACSGLSELGFSKLSLDAFASLSGECIRNTQPSAWKQVSTDQAAALNPRSCEGFQSRHLQAASTQAYAGFTFNCTAHLSYYLDGDGCGGVSSAGLAAMAPNSFAGFTSGCVSKFSGSAWMNVTSAQTSFLSSSCEGFDKDAMQFLSNSGYEGLRAACLAALTYSSSSSACVGITNDGLALIQPAEIGGLGYSCVSSIPSSAWSQIGALQVANLSSGSCGGLTQEQLTQFSDQAYSGFQKGCLHSLSAACESLRSSGVARIPASQFVGFRESCFSTAPRWLFQEASSEQTANLDPAACGGITQPQFEDMSVKGYAGLQKDCISAVGVSFSRQTCQGLSPSGITQIAPTSFSGFKRACIGQFLGTQMAAITPQQIKALPVETISGLQFLGYLEPATFSAMDLKQVIAFGSAGIGSLSASQLVELFGKWKTELLLSESGWSQSQVSVSWYAQIFAVRNAVAAGQLQRFVPLPSDWVQFSSRINWFHMILFDSAPGTGWDDAIVSALSARAAAFSFLGFTPDHVAKLTVKGAAQLGSNHTQGFMNDTVAALSPQQWAVLSPDAIQGIQGLGWENFECQDCVRILSATQVAGILWWADLPCATMDYFVVSQLSEALEFLYEEFNARRVSCKLARFPARSSAPDDVFVYPPFEPQTGWSREKIGAVVGGCLSGAICVVLLLRLIVRLRARRGYTQIGAKPVN